MNLVRGAAIVALSILAASLNAQSNLGVVKKKLRNGLTILLLEDRTTPTIAYHTLFKVGSRNEGPGITGLSHLFEHMMFNGSAKYKPKELDRIIEASGGGANAFTTQDTTEYGQEVIASAIEKVIAIEADRMRALTLTKENLEQERAIVKEERRSSLDDQILPSMVELLWNHAFLAHPYRWEILGFMKDIDAVTLDDARAYFKTYYAPNNAVLVLVGDFRPAQMMRKLERAYGRIPPQPAPRRVVNSEPEQLGEVRMRYDREAELPSLLLGYKGVSIRDKDDAALDVLITILAGGESSRLYKSLVYDKQIAGDVWASNDSRLDPGLITIYAQAQKGRTAEDCEKAVQEVVDAIWNQGVTDREVRKAKNGLAVGYLSSFKTNTGLAELLARYEGLFGDWQKLYDVPKKREAVTTLNVQWVARKYLKKARRTVIELPGGTRSVGSTR
ncbi:MAG: pitrilysin family protein, partial [Fimbriimonadaceae bacterium]